MAFCLFSLQPTKKVAMSLRTIPRINCVQGSNDFICCFFHSLLSSLWTWKNSFRSEFWIHNGVLSTWNLCKKLIVIIDVKNKRQEWVHPNCWHQCFWKFAQLIKSTSNAINHQFWILGYSKVTFPQSQWFFFP